MANYTGYEATIKPELSDLKYGTYGLRIVVLSFNYTGYDYQWPLYPFGTSPATGRELP